MIIERVCGYKRTTLDMLYKGAIFIHGRDDIAPKVVVGSASGNNVVKCFDLAASAIVTISGTKAVFEIGGKFTYEFA